MDVEAQSDDVAPAGRSRRRALFDAVERYGFRGCVLRRRGAGRGVVAVFGVVEVDAEAVGGGGKTAWRRVSRSSLSWVWYALVLDHIHPYIHTYILHAIKTRSKPHTFAHLLNTVGILLKAQLHRAGCQARWR